MENPFFEKPQSPLPSLAFVSVKGKQGQAGFIVNCTSVKGTFILAVSWSKAKIFKSFSWGTMWKYDKNKV